MSEGDQWAIPMYVVETLPREEIILLRLRHFDPLCRAVVPVAARYHRTVVLGRGILRQTVAEPLTSSHPLLYRSN
jgi:hypothetical protein